MANLFEVAKGYARKDIFSLAEIDLKALDIKEGTTKDGRNYKFFSKDNWDYTVKAEHLAAIQELINYTPGVNKIKLVKNDKGDVRAIPVN